MKKILDFSILFFFLILFLLQGSIETVIMTTLESPHIDETLQITNQNLEKERNELEEKLKIEPIKEQRIYSKMLYRDPFSSFHMINILKGSEEGVKENMAVLQNNNLIGITDHIENHHSEVKLLTNPSTSLSIKLNGSYGIMISRNEEMWIEDLDKNTKVEKENIIVTSGLTEIPENIPIGKVEEIVNDELGLIQKIKVRPLANFNEISYVTLLAKEMTP